MQTELIVVRSDKHTAAITRQTFHEAVNELAAMMPASIYNSRIEIAWDLALRGHIETLGYLYELTPIEVGVA